MPRLFAALVAFGVVAATVAANHAAGIAFNAKPGLWDVTLVGTTSGAPVPPPDLTPEERAHFERLMLGAGARMDPPRRFKVCLTQADLGRGPNFTDHRACVVTVVSGSTSKLEERLLCSDPEKARGTIDYAAPDPETVTGEFDLQVTNDGSPATERGHLEAKRLSSDCGGGK